MVRLLSILSLILLFVDCRASGNTVSPSSGETRMTVASVLPSTYTQDFDLATATVGGLSLALVCATSCSEPESAHSWARAFVIELGPSPRIVWQAEYRGEAFCESPATYDGNGQSATFSFVTRPYPGSIIRATLHLYDFRLAACSFKPLLVISYIDGGYFALKGAERPAIVVYEPAYEKWPKHGPQKYRFRVYVPRGQAYRFAGALLTDEVYATAGAAYTAIAAAVRELLAQEYLVPDSLPMLPGNPPKP